MLGILVKGVDTEADHAVRIESGPDFPKIIGLLREQLTRCCIQVGYLQVPINEHDRTRNVLERFDLQGRHRRFGADSFSGIGSLFRFHCGNTSEKWLGWVGERPKGVTVAKVIAPRGPVGHLAVETALMISTQRVRGHETRPVLYDSRVFRSM